MHDKLNVEVSFSQGLKQQLGFAFKMKEEIIRANLLV